MSDQPQYPRPYQQYAEPTPWPAGQPAPPPVYQVPVAPDGRPLAGAGQRLGARILDSLIQVVVTAVLAGSLAAGIIALLGAAGVADDSPLVPTFGISAVLLVVFGLQYLYEVELPLRWNGQTPGKRVLKIAVSALEPGVPLSRGRLAYRWVVMLGFNLLSNCYVGLIDPLWCLWDKPYQQCLHDKPARTVVVRHVPAPVSAF